MSKAKKATPKSNATKPKKRLFPKNQKPRTRKIKVRKDDQDLLRFYSEELDATEVAIQTISKLRLKLTKKFWGKIYELYPDLKGKESVFNSEKMEFTIIK